MTDHHDPLVITGLGMRTSVGHNVIQSCASQRAGINRFAQWDQFAVTLGEDDLMLSAAALRPDLGDASWVEKFESLATQPFLESLSMANLFGKITQARSFRWGVFLGLPRPDRAGAEESLDELMDDAREGMLFPLEPTRIELCPGDQVAGFASLAAAADRLQAGELDAAVVGGIDSLLHSPCLFDLLQQERLLTEFNPAGMIPGEAGAFVVVERWSSARERDAVPLAIVHRPHLEREGDEDGPTEPTTDASPITPASTGEALSKVLTAVLADAACEPLRIGRVLTDLNGERWRFLEFSFADARALTRLPPDWQVITPADCFGDTGAASGIAGICVATRALERGYGGGDAVPVCGSSIDGLRAAVCVSKLA